MVYDTLVGSTGRFALESSMSWVFFPCRCVKGEGEIEKLQAKVVELRRKLDDTTAAMQELGRENQSLQVRPETPQEEYFKEGTRKYSYTVVLLLLLLFWVPDQAVPVSDQEVGRGPRGAELHGLWEGFFCHCQEGNETVWSFYESPFLPLGKKLE